MASRKEVWKTEGVSTFSLGVLVRGHGIHIFCCLFVVRLYTCSVGYAELPVVLLYLLQWCITCCPKREEALEVYTE